MSELIVNPFLIAGYKAPEYFCDRLSETAELVAALMNGRNVTLSSLRRMGKTGLIHNTFHQLRQQGHKCIYVDIYGSQCKHDFMQLLVKAIIQGLQSPLERAVEIFRSCRPVMQSDLMTGKLSFSLEIQRGNADHTFDEAMTFLRERSKPLFIAIDEFQQIANYPESELEAELRSHIQFMPNVHFIFSGSKMHLLSEMFASPKRPFYMSTQMMSLTVINRATYYEFAARHFDKAGKRLPQELFDTIYDWYEGVTWYVQMMLNRLYQIPDELIRASTINVLRNELVEERADYFQFALTTMTPNQNRLLRAIAAEGSCSGILSHEFICRHHLPAASSVSAAARWLIDNDYILQEGDRYRVYDHYMAQWLKDY